MGQLFSIILTRKGFSKKPSDSLNVLRSLNLSSVLSASPCSLLTKSSVVISFALSKLSVFFQTWEVAEHFELSSLKVLFCLLKLNMFCCRSEISLPCPWRDALIDSTCCT
jgi:hypothetical protein